MSNKSRVVIDDNNQLGLLQGSEDRPRPQLCAGMVTWPQKAIIPKLESISESTVLLHAGQQLDYASLKMDDHWQAREVEAFLCSRFS